MLTDFEKEIKKKLIDLNMTHLQLAKKIGFSSSWGLRQAIKKCDEKIILKVKQELSI